MPSDNLPPMARSLAAISSPMRSISRRMAVARLRNTSPAGVSATPRACRASNADPKPVSSSRISRLSTGCGTPRRSAARVRLCNSAMARKCCQCRTFMSDPYHEGYTQYSSHHNIAMSEGVRRRRLRQGGNDSMQRYLAGIDIGGTFTDVVLIDGHGRVTTAKSPSTPPNFADGVVDALQLGAHRLGFTLEDLCSRIDMVTHGTTVGTNALIQKRGARVGIITTKGH